MVFDHYIITSRLVPAVEATILKGNEIARSLHTVMPHPPTTPSMTIT